MEITIEDVRQLTFELYLAQRENGLLRAENEELKRLLAQAGTDEPGGAG